MARATTTAAIRRTVADRRCHNRRPHELLIQAQAADWQHDHGQPTARKRRSLQPVVSPLRWATMYDPFPEAMPGLDWFEAGEAVFLSATDDSRFYPPLGDPIAQRVWLGGFASAWAVAGGDESVEEALDKALRGRAALDRQLRLNRSAPERLPLH